MDRRYPTLPLLSDAQVRELCSRRDAGDRDARNLLVEHNVGLVTNIVLRRYNHENVALGVDDLMQEGMLGLMRAADGFDPAVGYRFSTYAAKAIERAVQRAIGGKVRTIRVPPAVSLLAWKIERVRNEAGEELTYEELAERLEVRVSQIKAACEAPRATTSLDAPVGQSADGIARTVGEVIPDLDTPPMDEYAIAATRTKAMSAAIRRLPRELRALVGLHYGLSGEQCRTLVECADKLGYGSPDTALDRLRAAKRLLAEDEQLRRAVA